MTPHEAIDRLQALLVEERVAIRGIDANVVESLAMEKLMLLRAFTQENLRADPSMAAQFRGLTSALRNNAVILAHARNCLRDIVRLRAPTPATYGASGQLSASPKNGRLSITG